MDENEENKIRECIYEFNFKVIEINDVKLQIGL